MKQTAVEWLHDELLKILIDNQIQQTDYLFEQAKAMEKEQIKLAYSQGREDAGDFVLIEELRYIDEDYYTETYL
jgi:hypothetical protein